MIIKFFVSFFICNHFFFYGGVSVKEIMIKDFIFKKKMFFLMIPKICVLYYYCGMLCMCP
ncbi:hypothetical protein C1645_14906 [Glomus cerebriforme]|uniref:Uncharacterized protein n=1 Tax=Glomus cerebriforme TaxID=658196 RepID=A0A397SCQ5_9GLOM|nr:hypothetical protein C1645_14906 [Glomus cerebriforme]